MKQDSTICTFQLEPGKGGGGGGGGGVKLSSMGLEEISKLFLIN